MPHNKKCSVCASEFLANSHRQMHCSNDCALKGCRERFEDKFIKTGPNDCWIWKAAKNHRGYGLFKVGSYQTNAHRIAWALENGRIPSEEEHICHDCPGGDNTSCVNPAHLFLGDAQMNMTDKMKKGRHRVRFGDDRADAKLTKDQVFEIIERRKKGEIFKSIAKDYGVHWYQISRITRGERWAHVTGIKYVKPPEDPIMPKQETAETIVRLRKICGLQQQQLAVQIGISNTHLSDLEAPDKKAKWHDSMFDRALEAMWYLVNLPKAA